MAWTPLRTNRVVKETVSAADINAIAAAVNAAVDRANHSGTQTATTISDLVEVIQDTVAAAVVAGTGMTVAYDDVAGRITLNSAAGGGTGGATDPEIVRDVIGAALIAGPGIQITVNDAGDTLTITNLNSSDAFLRDRDNHTGTQPLSTIEGVPSNLVGSNVAGTSLYLSDTRPATLEPGQVWVALESDFVAASVQVSDLARPFVIPHRGGGRMLAPGNTRDAFRFGAALGLGAMDGGDWRVTTDGALFCMDPTTVDSLTTSTGSSEGMTYWQSQRLVVDASSWFGGGFADTTLPTAEDVFGVYGGSTILAPEPKTLAAANALSALIQRLGLERSVIPNSDTLTYLAPFTAIGCTDVQLNITTMPDAATQATWKAAGITWLQVPPAGTAITAANVTALRAAGFQINCGVVYKGSDLTPMTSVFGDISAYTADEPLYAMHGVSANYIARYRRTTDPFASQAFYHGHIPGASTNTTDPNPPRRGSFVPPNRWGFVVPAPGQNAWVEQGWNCPVPNPTADYTITGTAVFEALGTDTGRWWGGFFGMTTDIRFADINSSTETGYIVRMRATGVLEIQKRTAGVNGTNVVLAAPAAVSAPLTLSAAVPAGAVTALPVNAIPAALAVGARLALPTGQFASVATAAAVGATSVAVTSVTTTGAMAAGASIPQAVPWSVAFAAASVTFTRTDTGQSVALTGLTDASTRGGYWHLGRNDSNGASGLAVTFAQIVSV
jgi:hypothetical protein